VHPLSGAASIIDTRMYRAGWEMVAAMVPGESPKLFGCTADPHSSIVAGTASASVA
jgi:hypothetical protein